MYAILVGFSLVFIHYFDVEAENPHINELTKFTQSGCANVEDVALSQVRSK